MLVVDKVVVMNQETSLQELLVVEVELNCQDPRDHKQVLTE